MVARTPLSSTSTTRAPQVAICAVGLLHELAARRRARAAQMAGLVFLGRAHVEQVERALVGFGAPGRERRVVDAGNAAACGDPRRSLARCATPCG